MFSFGKSRNNFTLSNEVKILNAKAVLTYFSKSFPILAMPGATA